MACACGSETFLINLKTLNKWKDVVRIAGVREHTNIFTRNGCMEIVG